MIKRNLTQERLKELVSYNSETGIFTWSKKRSGVRSDQAAGYTRLTSEKSYCFIRIDRVLYRAHRLAWLYMKGSWPEDEIDHIDGNGLNNKIDNLRNVTRVENTQNVKRRSDNKSGVTGVYWFKVTKKWLVYIGTGKSREYLGYFFDKFEAICKRKSAENRLGYHENHGTERLY